MKKSIILLTTGVVLFLGVVGGYFYMDKNDESDVVYVVNYRYERMYCNFMINNIPIHHSIGKDLTIQWSFMDRIGILLNEGINTIGIEGVDITVADHTSFCEMSVNAYVYNPNNETVESKEVTSLRLNYDEDGLFTVSNSKHYEEPSLTGLPKLEDIGYASFHDSDPKLSNNVIASRSLEIKHPFRTHSWKYKSEPFVDTAENRKKLWRKYEEIVSYMNSKNYEGVLSLMQPGMSETEIYQGDPVERSWEKSMMMVFSEKWTDPDYTVELVPRDEVELITSPDRNLFRFKIKNSAGSMRSPIRINSYGRRTTTNLTFTLIDGEIFVAY